MRPAFSRPALRLRTPNPHLGAYFGIVTSAFISLAILLALLEQVGWREAWIAPVLILLPLVTYVAIAAVTRTTSVEDFFVCGRRVPAPYNGFVIAATAIGGIGFVAYTGTVFFLGFDALAIGLGWSFGLLAATVLFSPYLRKAGSFTLPSFLGQRFRSRNLRLMAALVLLVPVSILLAAEMKLAGVVAASFLPVSRGVAVAVVGLAISAVVVLGGMRSLTWTGGAQFVVGAVALGVPLLIVSVMLTVLPAPQLTYGDKLMSLESMEINAGIQPVTGIGPLIELPQEAPQASAKPFAQAFGAFGRFDFLVLFLSVALGTAAMPTLLNRSGVTLTVDDQRWAGAWAVLFVAFFALTVPAVAVFLKTLIFQELPQIRPDALPDWMNQLALKGLMLTNDVNRSGGLQADEVLVARDGAVFALPIAAGLPIVCMVVLASGAIALAMASAASHLFTIAASLAEDFYRLIDPQASLMPRHIAVWATAGAVAAGTAVFLAIADLDVLQAALTALAFVAASSFPVLLLAIWWERLTALGAMSAMATGGGVMMLELIVRGAILGEPAGPGMALVSLIGAALSFAAGIAVSLFISEATSVQDQRYFEALRDPEGEAIYDEALARAEQAQAKAAQAGIVIPQPAR